MRKIITSVLLMGVTAAASAGEFSALAGVQAGDIQDYAAGTAIMPAKPAADAAGARHYEIIIDCSQTPELQSWADSKLRPALEEWYPLIVEDLPSDGFTPPDRTTVTIEAHGDGIAYTADTHVVVMSAWIKSQMSDPRSEAVGSVIHELVHVVQQYGHGQGGSPAPGWLTEGIADYIRWWKFEPPGNRHPVSPVHSDGTPASYTDSYQTTAAFLEYVAEKYDHEIVVKLNTAGRESAYAPELWSRYTGKTADDLWAEFAKTLK